MSDIDNVLKDFLRSTRSMESNIVAVISDSNRDIEMILKELLIYLDATSKNLEKVQKSLVEFMEEQEYKDISNEISKITSTIKTYQKQLLVTESSNTKKIFELIKQVGISNQKFLKQILIVTNKIANSFELQSGANNTTNKELQEIKNLLQIVTGEVKDTKSSVSKNQGNLMSVIENMMNSNMTQNIASGKVESQKIKSEEEKFKAKVALVGKIIGILLGSGGVIYLVIDVLLKAG